MGVVNMLMNQESCKNSSNYLQKITSSHGLEVKKIMNLYEKKLITISCNGLQQNFIFDNNRLLSIID